ncbi:MAG: Vancomycin B-type resistance protein VanW [Myxococcaceae bacterium]|nr:Vancomycin B-type resistance protein VanW [Myxococcaceae bacterium]
MALPPRAEPAPLAAGPLSTSVPPPRAPFDPRLWLALVLLGSAFGLSGYVLWSDAQAHAATLHEARVLGTSLGRELQTQGDVSVLASKLSRAFLRQALRLQVGPKEHVTSRSALGVRVDLAAFTELLRAASDAGSPLRRLHAQQRGEGALDLPVPARLEGDAAERWLQRIAADFDEAPRAARVATKTGALIAARPGRKLDVPATLDALGQAIFHGTTKVRSQLRVLSAPSSRFSAGQRVELTQVLGSFESLSPMREPARTQVLEAAVRKLDGALIAPGETFDFLESVGELRGGRSFVNAGTSLTEGDRLEAALSQVASTVYAAALFGGLPIVEQHARVRPSSDIELGFDAAISARHNLRIQNDRPFPIALTLSLQSGRLRAALRGAPGHTREVDIERAIDEITPYVELTRADDSLPAGAVLLLQRGRPGLRVQLTRSVRESEDDTSQREQRSATYAPSPRIVRLGTGPSDRPLARAPEQPGEYLVDELVAFGMRPGLELPQESERRAGRTGVEGWTAQDGP